MNGENEHAMSRDRKLQGEITRTLKKIDEGVGIFDELYEKVYDAETQSQKLKYEGDLNKEIKKLQRHRDSLKRGHKLGHQGQVEDSCGGKLIESKMEAFKIYGDEDEGVLQGGVPAKELDPEDKKRKEARDGWRRLEAIKQ